MLENQEGKTDVEGFYIAKNLMKGKRLQRGRMRKCIKIKGIP